MADDDNQQPPTADQIQAATQADQGNSNLPLLMRIQAAQAQAPAQPQVLPPAQSQQNVSQVPKPGLPAIAQLIGGMIHPDNPRFGGTSTNHPQGSRLTVFENFLSNFVQAMGAGFANARGPGAFGKGFGAAVQAPYQNELQRYQLGLEAQKTQAEAGLQRAQTENLRNVVQTPYGPMSAALAAKVFPAAINAQSRVDAKRFMAVPNVGLVDTQAQGGPAVVPGTNGNTVTVTPDVAQQYSIPAQLIGKQIPLSQFSQMERGGAMQWATVQGASGPALVNKGTGTTRNLGLGNPGVATATARAGVTPVMIPDPLNPGAFKTVSALDAIRSGATMVTKPNGQQVMAKQALIDDIKGGIGQLKASAGVLDNAKSRVKIAAAMAEPGITSQTFLQSPIMGDMNEDEQNYTVQLLSLREQAMAMRSVLGAGQGSEDLRKAILKTVPGAQTPNSQFAVKQLDQFATVLDRLSKGVPRLNGGAASSSGHLPGNPFAK